MKLRKVLTTFFALLLVVVVAVGCSKGSKNTKEAGTEYKAVKTINSLKGKTYISKESYKGKATAKFDSVTWKKLSDKYSLKFISEKEAFVGKYVDGKLSYGRFYQVTNGKNGFFNFKQTKFVTDNSNYVKMNSKVKKNYAKVDAKDVPDAAKGVQYYQARKSKNDNTTISYRLYKVNKDLVRENKPKNGVHYYVKNTVKED